MNEDLKQCPFCGGEAKLYSNFSTKADHYYIYVQCATCYARGKTVKSQYPAAIGINGTAGQEAISAWNRREGTA